MRTLLQSLNATNYGAISISTSPSSKFYNLRMWIIAQTKFVPVNTPISARIYCILNDLTQWPKCQCGCGSDVNKVTSRFLPSHGNRSNEVQQKKSAALIAHYGEGVTNPSQATEVLEKKRETSRKNFNGASHYMQDPVAYANFTAKMKGRSGVDNPFQLESTKEIISKKWKENKEAILTKRSITAKRNFCLSLFDSTRLGNRVTPNFTIEEYQGIGIRYQFKCNKCQSIFLSDLDDGKIPRCIQCHPLLNKRGTSNIEQEVYQFILTLDPLAISGHRSLIHPYELDIVSFKHQIAIELNGLYWHSELNGKDSTYHLNKLHLTEVQGFRLIHIFEDEWMNKPEIVKMRLRMLFKANTRRVFARKCQIREISVTEKNIFLDNFHLQGSDRSAVKLGLYYQDELVNVMTFSKQRVIMGKRNSQVTNWELSRFCSGDTQVVGGASKLLSHFKKNYSWNEIITYADRRWSDGNVYHQLGFQLQHQSAPGYWYLKIGEYQQREYRYKYAKHQLKNMMGELYNDALTEWGNMQVFGYDRIWDCGNLVFKISKSQDNS